MSFRAGIAIGVGLLMTVAVVRPATAQWYFSGYGGASHTRSADVTVKVPAAGLAVTYQNVAFSSASFTGPPYLGARVGHFFGATRKLGIEFEILHLKMIADTSRTYGTTGQIDGVALPAGMSSTMSDVVQQFRITHGLNFLLINLVWRQAIGSAHNPRLALWGRVGAGPTLPHPETTVLTQHLEEYELRGAGADASLGFDCLIVPHFSAFTEYRVTYARPSIAVVGGAGGMSALSQEWNFGLSVGSIRGPNR